MSDWRRADGGGGRQLGGATQKSAELADSDGGGGLIWAAVRTRAGCHKDAGSARDGREAVNGIELSWQTAERGNGASVARGCAWRTDLGERRWTHGRRRIAELKVARSWASGSGVGRKARVAKQGKRARRSELRQTGATEQTRMKAANASGAEVRTGAATWRRSVGASLARQM